MTLLERLQQYRGQLQYYDFIEPSGDMTNWLPKRRTWYGRLKPMPLMQDLIVWAGAIARDEVLRALDEIEKEDK